MIRHKKISDDATRPSIKVNVVKIQIKEEPQCRFLRCGLEREISKTNIMFSPFGGALI